MIIVHFKVTCQPGKAEHAMAVMQDVIMPSRALAGVVSFDIGRDILDPDSILAVEVFEDRDALNRQESLAQVGKVMAVLPQLLAAPPEATIYHVSSSEAYE